MTPDEQESSRDGYKSWYALPDLVGREEIIQSAITALTSNAGQRVVFLLGEGGMGKTRVLKEIIKRLQKTDGIHTVEREVDLYHTEVHTANGLADALYDASPFLEDAALVELYGQLVNQWVAGVGSGSAKLRKEHLDLFEAMLTKICQQQPVVLALDTVEKIFYGFPDLPAHLQGDKADAWRWLLGLLEQIPGLRLVVSGRPEAEPLVQEMQRRLGSGKVLSLPIGPLSEEEGLAYFAAIEQEARGRGDHRLLRNLEAVDAGRRRQAVKWAGGIPIRLALMIDYMMFGGPLPVQDHVPQEEWEARFCERLRKEDFAEILLALGRLPKGADQLLIFDILGYGQANTGERMQATKLLGDMQRFTFTKVLQARGKEKSKDEKDKRYFLHDEMYRILQKQVYAHPENHLAAENAYKAIQAYYARQQLDWQKQIQNLFEPIEEGSSEKIQQDTLSELYRRKIHLLTADVYYALRKDRDKGLRRRYRYTRDADLSGNIALDYALQAELLAFMRDHADSIDRFQFQGMLMMRPVVRAWVEEDYKEAVRLAAEVREQARDLLADRLNIAILDVWEAYALIYLGGRRDRARELLDGAIAGVEEYESRVEDDLMTWRGRAVLAFALRVRAYLFDGEMHLAEAEEDYRRAARLWRDLNFQIESATTLKDLAYSLSLQGKYELARLLIDDARELHHKLASMGNVGLSFNARALIRIEDGDYAEAIEDSRRALRIFQAINSKRGIGLAGLALTEATRRYMGPSNPLSLGSKLDKLEEVYAIARESYNKLNDIAEEANAIAAMIEMGCNRRDIVHICKENPDICIDKRRRNAEELEKESADILRSAAERANKIENKRLQLDALVNLGWLGYYAVDDVLCAESKMRIRGAVVAFYPDSAEHPTVTAENRNHGGLWEQVGKHYVVLGALEFRQTRDSDIGKDKLLRLTGELWTRALHYGSQKGTEYETYRLDKAYIYKHLKVLNTKERKQVVCGIVRAERELAQENNSLMRRFMEETLLWVDPDTNTPC